MVIVDEARGVGLGLGKEREKWDTLQPFATTLRRGAVWIFFCQV